MHGDVPSSSEENMSLDVVSGGELYTALQAGFPASRIHFHGNNKTEEEIVMALQANIGCFVVDNFLELEILHDLAVQHGKFVNILIRVTPGVEAHTHEYITTGQDDSKFDLACQMVKRCKQLSLLYKNQIITC